MATIIFAILAWFIKYPDIIPAQVQIMTENPAIRIIPLASGKLKELLVKNQETVKEGALLAAIENPIERTAILELEQILSKITAVEKPKQYLNIELPEELNVGNLQTLYAGLTQKIEDYQHYLRQRTPYKKIKILNKQIGHALAQNQTLKKQQQTLAKEVAIAKKNYQRNQLLNQEGVISDLDLEQIETAWLQYQRQLDNFESQIINNKVQAEQLETQILDLKQNRKDGRAGKELAIKETVQNLKSQIAIWKQTYLIKAPIAGQVNFSNIRSVHQFVTAGEELLTIVPAERAGAIIGKALLPIENSGKVKIGQAVNIRLNGFPFLEYGILKSEVVQIALLPQEEHYILELAMPDTLITTYNKVIPFTQEMQGAADIITEDRRILQRIFDRVWSLLKNNS